MRVSGTASSKITLILVVAVNMHHTAIILALSLSLLLGAHAYLTPSHRPTVNLAALRRANSVLRSLPNPPISRRKLGGAVISTMTVGRLATTSVSPAFVSVVR